MSSTLKCGEASEEAEFAGKEKLFQLGCYISHGKNSNESFFY